MPTRQVAGAVNDEGLPEIEWTEEILQKSTLRGYTLPDTKEKPDVVVLVHKCEGRVFLTDRNGFYNDLLVDCWTQTQGNVIILLTGNRNQVGLEEIVNSDVIKLAQHGD